MFTGIIRRIGEVTRAERAGGLLHLTVTVGELARQAGAGDSVAVDGVCLTATAVSGESAAFEAGEESLRVTTLGEFRPRRRVNIELPLRAGDPLGGHIVQGHVDGVGTIVRIESGSRPAGVGMEISVPPALAEQMVLKGSVAVDGVSLTLSALKAASFEVFLIPHTLQATTLGTKDVGSRVNIETDVLGKYVAKILGAQASAPGAPAGPPPPAGLSERMLEEHGFK
jgi:riboflavin synthase